MKGGLKMLSIRLDSFELTRIVRIDWSLWPSFKNEEGSPFDQGLKCLKRIGSVWVYWTSMGGGQFCPRCAYRESWESSSFFKPKESKPPLVNQQCVVYHFKNNLCDVDYVVYTCRHLYQRIEERKGSAIGKHVRDQRGRYKSHISLRCKILRKCQDKFDCEMNTQSDSIRAKLFL